MGITEKQMPMVVPMGEAAGTLPGSDAVITGGTIDAFCDQIVSGAIHKGDVLVIFGATLICWVICDEWLTIDGLISYPSTTPDRYLVGGPSNAGALFVDWARQLLRDTPRPGPKREQLEPRLGTPDRVPVLAALCARRADALRGPHVALQHLRARHRVGRGSDGAGRLRGERVRGAAHD